MEYEWVQMRPRAWHHLDELFAAAPDPKERWTPEGVNHGDILAVMPEEYQARVTSFQDAFAR